MEKETNSTVDFLNNIDGVEETTKDIFKESPVLSEEKEPEVEEKAEKRLPFNKDPKVQRYIDEEIDKRLKFVRPSEEQKFRQEVQSEINLPPALVKLVGNDTPEKREALKELSEYLDTLPKKAQEQFEQKMLEEQQRTQEEDAASLNELNSGFEDIEESYGVDLSSNTQQAQKTRASFVEYLRKVSHKNENGEVDQFADIPAAWEEFQERNKPQSASRAKELASRGMARSTEASTAPQWSSSGDPWKNVDRHFEQLKRTN